MLGLVLALSFVAYLAYSCFIKQYLFLRRYAKHGFATSSCVPVLGHLVEFQRAAEAGDMDKEYARLVAKQPNAAVLLGPWTWLYVSEPGVLRQIFTSKAHCYHKNSDTIKSILRPLLGNGVLMSEDQLWKTQRGAVEPHFHHANLAKMVSTMVARVDEMMGRWNDEVVQGDGSTVVEMRKALNWLGLEVVASALFSSGFHDDRAKVERFTQAQHEYLLALRDRTAMMFFPILPLLPLASKKALRDNARIVRDIVEDIIEARLQNPHEESEDLLDEMIEISEFKTEGGMAKQQLFDESVNFLAAGAETTSTLMVWLVHELLQHPDVWAECEREVRGVVGDSPQDEIDYDVLRRLVFVEACIYEALRLHPPAPLIQKMAIKDHTLQLGNGQEVPIDAGQMLFTYAVTLQCHPDHWPEPERFDPQRFLAPAGAPPSAVKKPHAYTWLGFSAGPRKCLGKNFAMLEIKCMVARLVTSFEASLVPAQKIVKDWSNRGPMHGLQVELRPKEPRPSASSGDYVPKFQIVKPVGMI